MKWLWFVAIFGVCCRVIHDMLAIVPNANPIADIEIEGNKANAPISV